MGKIDYKIFVPSGTNNYIRFNTGSRVFEIPIETIATITIHLVDDKIVYWLYFKIAIDDMFHQTFFRKNKKPSAILLLGNNPYEIHGEAEVITKFDYIMEQKTEIKLVYTVTNVEKTVTNPRKEIKTDETDRFEMIDI